ncbi:MAG TPA: hypothetical protein VL549_09005 [Gemmatimonadales bacterium]|nr:hypothetical protein [Gemmatimonadales bacterium]
MGIWNSTLAYVGARTLLAGAMIAVLLRRRVGPWHAGGQIVSDLACAAFLLGYSNPDIRDDIGWLVLPLLLFVFYWEATRFLENRYVAATREDQETLVDGALRVYGLAWLIGFVLPAVLAGGFLCFNLLAPGQWPFPNPRPPLACSPNRLQPGATLTLTIQVPHGSQLAVFTPKHGAVVLIPYGAKQFQYMPTLRLAPDTLPQVFADSGVYAVIISSEAELSASLMCRVRYTGRVSG